MFRVGKEDLSYTDKSRSIKVQGLVHDTRLSVLPSKKTHKTAGIFTGIGAVKPLLQDLSKFGGLLQGHLTI